MLSRMAPFICCGFRRPPSPQENPSRLISPSETGRRFTISTNDSHDETKDLNRAEKYLDAAKKRSSSTSPDSTFHSQQHHGSRPGHKKSLGRVHTAAARVKKKVSRDSGFPKGSYRMNSEEIAKSRGRGKNSGSRPEKEIEDDWSDILDEVREHVL